MDELLEVAGEPLNAEDEGILEAMREALRDSKAPVQLHWENICGQNAWD
jgi:hypothetical protein